jgi:signal transduction histidine kinase
MNLGRSTQAQAGALPAYAVAPRWQLARLLAGLALPLGCLALTAGTVDVSFATRNGSACAALEMTTVLVAGLAAYLLHGRGRVGAHGRDLLLSWIVGVIAVAEGAFSLLPDMVDDHIAGGLVRADPIARLLIALLLAVAAFAPGAVLDRTLRRRTDYTVGAMLLGIALALLAVAVLLPVDTSAASPPAEQAPMHLAAALIAGCAGAALAARAIRAGTELQSWFAAAIILTAGASLDAGVDPVLTPPWITTADALRFAAAALLLAGAVRQRGTHPGPATSLAVAEERRRIARELHDGLAQELAYIASLAPRMAATSGDPTAARLSEAAASALDESRLAITALSDGPREPLGTELARTAQRIAQRAGAAVALDVQADVDDVALDVRRDLLRIVREATTNAVRHGRASHVTISLARDEVAVLRVADDGIGFTPGATAAGLDSGFGLASMRERAEHAGGELIVRSAPGRGTVIEVRLG